MAGPVEINPTPQEVSWSVPLDEDTEHSRYDTEAVERYFSRGHRGRARAGGLPRAVQGPLDAGERVVGVLRPGGEPVLGRPCRPPVPGLHHAQRDGRGGGGRRLVAWRRPLRTRRLLRLRTPGAPKASRRRRCRAEGRHDGSPSSASTCSTGKTSASAMILAGWPSVRRLRLSPRLRDVPVGRSPACERGRVTATGELSGAGRKRLHACPRGTPSHNNRRGRPCLPLPPQHRVGSRRYGSSITMMPQVANMPVPPDAS